MRICEISLVCIIAVLGIYVIYTDLKYGIVKNRAILLSLLLGSVINGIYYRFCNTYLKEFCLNLIAIMLISLFLYCRHYWAAGDSKLLICMTMLIPGRLYNTDSVFLPGIYCLMFIFIVSFLYVTAESLWAWVRKHSAFHYPKVSLRQMAILAGQYIVILVLVRLITSVWRIVFGELYFKHLMVFSVINIILINLVISTGLFNRRRVFFAALLFAVASAAFLHCNNHKEIIFVIKNSFIIWAVYGVSYFVNGYNYQEILTKEVKPGMILSSSTIMLLSTSKIKGLPQDGSEDMRARLSEEETKAIIRWGESSKGRDKILIVKKIPFAVFIVLGTVLYIVLRSTGKI